MFIGEVTLKTANYNRRLAMLLDDLRGAGCTVWLEGLRVRFDLPGEAETWAEAAKLDRLLARYSDIVSWLPLGEVAPASFRQAAAPRQRVLFGRWGSWPRPAKRA